MGLVDSHCHLDGPRFAEDREAVIDRALQAGVERMLSIGSGDGPPDLETAIRIADQYAPVWATVGVHPHDAEKATGATMQELEALLRHPKVVGLGEIGLDYHYENSPREVQKAVFRDQLAIARQAGVPVIIHTREAWDDTFAILEECWVWPGTGVETVLPGIMHCFSGGVAEAERSMAMGFRISIAGVVTFPKSDELRAAAKTVPDDRLLVETDSPYLAPVPYRGKRNEPSYVVETAKRVAAERGVTYEELCRVTTANFDRLFPAAAMGSAGKAAPPFAGA
ncbi:MAG: TatD family hydrolase [Acidobacteriota bacterium]